METRTGKSEYLFRAFAMGFGAGRLPLAPGTWGALEGLAVVYLIHRFAPVHFELLLGVLCLTLGLLAVWASDRVARSLRNPDPQQVVADEIVGQMTCFLWVPVTMTNLIAGFILFRVFDISKPFPAGRAEHLPGGLGIIADDLVAGLYAGLILKIAGVYLVNPG
ncbi:MAG: phosphatidylglycerophosphatase A [Acidobacteria bacterium]|nr:MAG: phosphatidylglycerophosphatase A [Acidobacteriota bacterium]